MRAKVTASRQTFPQPLSHTPATQKVLGWLPPGHLARLVAPMLLLPLNDPADPRSNCQGHWMADCTGQLLSPARPGQVG